MHRQLVTTEMLSSDSPELDAAAKKHLKVVRPENGERIELFDGRGAWREYVWEGRLKASGEMQRIERSARSVTLFACVTKGSRWDWTVEKATELGADRIVPVISERTIVRIVAEDRAAKRERWTRIAEEAAAQCGTRFLPEIMEPVDFKAALELVKGTRCFIGALTEPPSPMLSAAIAANADAKHLATFIGPEGDFTPAELAALSEIAIPTSFGRNVLRAETAAVYAITLLVASQSHGAMGTSRPTN